MLEDNKTNIPTDRFGRPVLTTYQVAPHTHVVAIRNEIGEICDARLFIDGDLADIQPDPAGLNFCMAIGNCDATAPHSETEEDRRLREETIIQRYLNGLQKQSHQPT